MAAVAVVVAAVAVVVAAVAVVVAAVAVAGGGSEGIAIASKIRS